MQAARLLRKLCAVAFLSPLAAHAGDVRISIRIPWLVPSILAALFPPPPPRPSAHHLSPAQPAKILRGGVAIDGRSFVANGIHYRLYGVPPAAPGSAEEAQARSALQRRLDAGPIKARLVEAQAGGFHIVALERDG